MAEVNDKSLFGQAFKSGLGAVFGGLPGALAQFGLGLFTSSKQRKNNREDLESMLSYNSPSQQMQRLKQAGINPNRALANGQIENSSPLPVATDVPGAFGSASSSFDSAVQNSMAYRANEAQVKNIEAQTEKTKQETVNLAVQQKLLEFEANPEILQIKKHGLQSIALKQYAEADLTTQQTVKCVQEVANLCEELKLTQAQTEKVQNEASKVYTECLNDLKDLEVKDQQIALDKARELLTVEQRNTERSAQAVNKQSVEESKSRESLNRTNESETKKNGVVNRAKTRVDTAAQRIANRMNEFQQSITEASGSVLEQGALIGAKRIKSLINPLEGLIGN